MSPDTSPEVKVKAAPKPKTPKPKAEPPTPTRQSARIATRLALAELSGDEAEKISAPSKASCLKDCVSGNITNSFRCMCT